MKNLLVCQTWPIVLLENWKNQRVLLFNIKLFLPFKEHDLFTIYLPFNISHVLLYSLLFVCNMPFFIKHIIDLFQLLRGFHYLPTMLSCTSHSGFLAFLYFLQSTINNTDFQISYEFFLFFMIVCHKVVFLFSKLVHQPRWLNVSELCPFQLDWNFGI